MESGDARDVEKRDSEKWRSPVTLLTLGTWKKERILKKKKPINLTNLTKSLLACT